MGEVAESLLNFTTSNIYVASALIFAAALLAFAKFLGAIDNIYIFISKLRHSEKATSQEELELLKRNVLYCPISNNIPVELHKLRAFMIQKNLVEHPKFNGFFAQWLSNPAVIAGLPCLNAFTQAELQEIDNKLRLLKL